MKNKKTLNEVVDINGSKVFVENGKITKILNESNMQVNYIDVESAFELINNEIDRIYQNEV